MSGRNLGVRAVALVVSVICFRLVRSQLNFVSLGNFGAGDGGVVQHSVASNLKLAAREHAISFIISPGNNFAGGIRDLNDSRWETVFRAPYRSKELNVPFFTVLGEEDWKGNHTALAEYTHRTYDVGVDDAAEEGLKWTLPNWWYHYAIHYADASSSKSAAGSLDGSAGFVFIDTAILKDSFKFPNITRLHWNELRSSLVAATKIFDWVFVVGDRAILSSGSSKGDSFLSNTLRHLLKETKVDAYISGSDPNMEVIEDGTLLHVNCGNGGAGDLLPRAKEGGSVLYSGRPGFCRYSLTGQALKIVLTDGITGSNHGNYTKLRNIRSRSLLNRFNIYQKQPAIRYIPIPEGTSPESLQDDVFVRTVGTMGLIVITFLSLFHCAVLSHKLYRKLTGSPRRSSPLLADGDDDTDDRDISSP